MKKEQIGFTAQSYPSQWALPQKNMIFGDRIITATSPILLFGFDFAVPYCGRANTAGTNLQPAFGKNVHLYLNCDYAVSLAIAGENFSPILMPSTLLLPAGINILSWENVLALAIQFTVTRSTANDTTVLWIAQLT